MIPRRKLSDPLNRDNSMFSPTEHPECPACGEYLPTDYLGHTSGPCVYCDAPVPRRHGRLLRFILVCSIAALIGVLLAKFLFGQTISSDSRESGQPAAPAKTEDQQKTPVPIGLGTGVGLLQIQGRTGAGMQTWMTIEGREQRFFCEEGFHPTYTHIYSDYQPLWRKLPNGQWEIMFVTGRMP